MTAKKPKGEASVALVCRSVLLCFIVVSDDGE